MDPIFEAAVLPAPFIVPIYLTGEDRSERDYILNTQSVGTVLALVESVVARMIYYQTSVGLVY